MTTHAPQHPDVAATAAAVEAFYTPPTATVYRLAPHPFLDIAVQVIREMEPNAVIVVDGAA